MSLYHILYRLTNELNLAIGGSAALKIYHNNYSHIQTIDIHYDSSEHITPETLRGMCRSIIDIFRSDGIKLSRLYKLEESSRITEHPYVFFKAGEVPENSEVFRNTSADYHVSLTHVKDMSVPQVKSTLIYLNGIFYFRKVVLDPVLI